MKVHCVRVKVFPLVKCSSNVEFCVLQQDNCKCAAAGSKCRNLMLGEKEEGSERAFGALVGVRLSCLKFNRSSVLVLTWHPRCGSPQ